MNEEKRLFNARRACAHLGRELMRLEELRGARNPQESLFTVGRTVAELKIITAELESLARNYESRIKRKRKGGCSQ
jgi:hypothetical protein